MRGLAIRVDQGNGRCHVYELEYDEAMALLAVNKSEAVRVVNDMCSNPPVTTMLGSGVCAHHEARLNAPKN
jgi:hypothetical protein